MDALGINIPGLIAQIVNFLLLMLVLYLVAYKPVIRMMDQRSKRIQGSLEQAELLTRETSRAEDEVKKQLDEARLEGRNLVQQAAQVAERLRVEAQSHARVEADGIVVRARESVQRERDDAIEELRRQFADLTVVAAERVIKASVSREQHQHLIDEVLEESSQFKRS